MKTVLSIAITCFSLSAFAQKGAKEALKGNEAYKKGDFKQANTSYDEALKKDSANTTYLFNKGNALEKTGSHVEAKNAYTKAATNSTDKKVQSQSYYNKGVAETRQNNLQEAVTAFKQALRLDPNDEQTRQNLQKAMNELKKQQQNQQPKDNKKQPPPPQNDQQQKPKPKPEEQKMDKQKAEQLLQQLRNEEKRLQQEVQKQKTRQISPEKDW